MTSLTPLIKYSFESWTPGSTTIINEGSSGSTNDGVLQNGAIVISSDYAVGKNSLMVGNCGSTFAYSYLSMSGTISLTNNFTICFWHKSLGAFTGSTVIFRLANISKYLALQVLSGNNFLSLSYNYGTNYNTFNYTTTSSLSTNTWHHYAVVRSYTDANFYFM